MMGDPSKLSVTRNTAALERIFPTDLSREENNGCTKIELTVF
jgi:hypothetical protein